MSETVERNNRIFKTPDGKVLTENEQLKEWLVIANKHNEELQKERDMYKTSFETMSTNYFRLENIIKTFVEDLDKTIEFCTNEADGTTNDKICRITIQYLKHLKEILDKEVNK